MSERSSESGSFPGPANVQAWRERAFADQAAAFRDVIRTALLTPQVEYPISTSGVPRAVVDQVMAELKGAGWNVWHGDQRNAGYIFIAAPRSRR